MAKKSTFLEMHDAVGGSYSSQARVQKEQAHKQKQDEAIRQFNQQAAANNAAKNQAEKQISTTKQSMLSPTRTSVQVPQAAKPKTTTGSSQLSGADQTIRQYEKIIKDLEKKRKPVGMGNTDQATRDYNATIDASIQDYKNQIGQIRDMQVTRQNQAADEKNLSVYASMPQEDRDALDAFISQRDVDFYESVSNGVNGIPGATLGRAERQYQSLIGKYGADTINKLAEYRKRQRNAQQTQQVQEETQQWAEEHPYQAFFGGSIASIPMNTLFSGAGAVESLRELGTRTGQYATLDPNNIGNLPSTFGSTVQSQVAQNIAGDDGNALRQGLAYGYRGFMSAVESGLRGLTGKAGTVILSGLGSFSQTVNQASAQGASPGKAIALGLTNAAIEGLSEEIPLDNLLAEAKKGGKGFTKALKSALIQAGIEASTEEASLVGTTLMEMAILQEQSGFQQTIQEHMAAGEDYATARRAALQDILNEAAETAIVSGISGSLMDTVNTLFVNFAERKINKLLGNQTQVDTDTQTDTDISDTTQQTTETPLQGEAANPAMQDAQREQAAVAQQEAQTDTSPSNPIMDTMLDPLGQEQTQPNPALENLSPYPTPDTAQPQQQVEIDPMLEGIQQPPVAEQVTDNQPQSAQPMQQAAEDVSNVNENNSTLGMQADPYAPSIKGTGAAEENFTGKPAYNATLSETNAQADRASDVRPMELPKTDINGNPISEVTGNVYGSKFTPDYFASLMEEPTARGDFSYAKITNDQATQMAMDSISSAGDWDAAYGQWSKDVGAGKAGAEMAARGALLLNQAAQEGNKVKWLNILADMQDLGTNTAQGLQAFRILRELNPQDKAKFVEMATKRLGQKMGVDFTVDQSLYDAYNNATTDEARNTALSNIEQAVADQIPSTILEKWNAMRYTNMLGNLKTNARNIAGNVGAGAMYRVKDQIAATMEGVLSKATGGKFERTKSHTVSRELVNACKQYFDMDSGIVSDGGKFGTQGGFSDDFTQGVMDKRRIFKSDNKVIDTLLKPLEGYRKATNWAMNNQYFGDEAFGKAAYARSMAGYLKAHGVTDTDLSKVDTTLMDKARTYAVQEAQEATFHDNSALARTMSKLKRNTGVVGEGIMPFTKTPANVLTRAEEFSPLGFINTAVDAAKAAKGTGDVTGVDVVNSLAKSLTGTGIFALGAWLKSQGFLTGGPDDDEDKDYFDKLNGDQNYAIRFTIDGKPYNFTLDWLTPAAMPLFMGGQFMDIMEKGFENLTFADLENVFTSIADPMLQMSMLQSLNDSLDNIKYTDNNLGQFFINAAVSYLTQGFGNTLLGQIERSAEKNRMTTYVDKDSQVPAWIQRQLGSLSQKIPGWDYHQVEYRNEWGETEANEGGLLYNLLSPGYISEEKSDALSKELYRLNDAGVEANVFPDSPSTTFSYTDKNGDRHEDYNLSAQEADTLKEVSGKTSATLLSDLIGTDMYNSMTDAQKADAVSLVYDYARELGRTEAIESYDGMDSWMENLEDNATDVILNKVVTSSFSDAFQSLTGSWDYGKSTDGALSDLDQAYSLYSGMSQEEQEEFRKENGGRIGYFLTAKEAGISTERFAELYSTYRSLDNNDDLTTQEKAQQWSSELARARRAGKLTPTQASAIKESMVFRQTYVAKTEKYDSLVESGLSPDTADKITHLLDGIQGTGKDGYVRDIDKYSAIAGSSLSTKDKEIALYEYMPDAMDEKYTYAKKNMTKNGRGITVDDFVAAYKITDQYSKKKEQIAAWRAMGYTAAEAENLWKLYGGKLT